jgi:DNA-binding response OmpR family regulator
MSTVVIVEDDDDFREVLALALVNSGFAVHDFAHEDAAAYFVNQNAARIDGLVADAVLVGGNGINICQTLIRLNPKARVVIMSGDDRRVQEAKVAGFLAVTKPLHVEDLCRVLRGE